MRNKRIERLAEYLCSEFDFNLNPCVGYSWPEHENDDGYRGDGSFVKLQPSDVQAYARENAKRILAFLEREAALSAAEPVSSIVPDHCSGTALVFQGGCLHVRADGSGHIVVDEDDFKLEDDRCEGEHGPEGSVHWIARFPAGEMTALRNFLNGQDFPAPPALSAQVQDVARTETTTRFHIEWIAGARPPAHPKPMTGRASFETFDLALRHMRNQADDAQFVSLEERRTTVVSVDRSEDMRAMLAAAPAKQEGGTNE